MRPTQQRHGVETIELTAFLYLALPLSQDKGSIRNSAQLGLSLRLSRTIRKSLYKTYFQQSTRDTMGAFTEVAKASPNHSPISNQTNPAQPKSQHTCTSYPSSIPKLTSHLLSPKTDPPPPRPNSLSPLPPPRTFDPPSPAKTPRALQPIPAPRNPHLNLHNPARPLLEFPDTAGEASRAGG